MKKTIIITTFSVFILALVITSFLVFNNLHKVNNITPNVNQAKNTEQTVDSLLEKQKEEFKNEDQYFQKVVEESDFNPKTASPQEVINKLDKLDQIIK